MTIRFLVGAAVILLLLPPLANESSAQNNRVVAIGDWAYRHIERLQRRGLMTDLNPTDLPYHEGEIMRALRGVDPLEMGPLERLWYDALLERFPVDTSSTAQGAAGVSLMASIDASDSERLDPLRPLGDDPHVYDAAVLQFFGESGRWIAHFGMRHDLYYDRDPDAIDTANRLMVRSEDAYAGYRGRLLTAYAGRYSSHWAAAGDDALFISSNPRSFDAFNVRLGGRKFSLRTIYGELDSITGDGRFTGAAGADSVASGSEKRIVVAHRIDWRPSRHVQIVALESTLFSGVGTSLSPRLLNPAHAWGFESDNRPKNDENNGLLGGLIWMNFGRVTLHGQLLIDDFDLQRQSGEPTSYALSGSFVYGGLTPRVDAGVRLTVVAARTFNAHEFEGQYIYVGRGLATQWSDYMHVRVFGDIYLDDVIPGLSLSPRFEFLSQGEADMRDAFPPTDVDAILVGTAEHTYRGAIEIYYQPTKYWWAGVNLGANHVRNVGHVEGATDTRFSGMVSVGARIAIRGGVDLWN